MKKGGKSYLNNKLKGFSVQITELTRKCVLVVFPNWYNAVVR